MVKFGQVWSSLVKSGQVLTSFVKFGQVWSIFVKLVKFGQVCGILIHEKQLDRKNMEIEFSKRHWKPHNVIEVTVIIQFIG